MKTNNVMMPLLEITAVGLNGADENDDEDEPEIQHVTTQDAKKL